MAISNREVQLAKIKQKDNKSIKLTARSAVEFCYFFAITIAISASKAEGLDPNRLDLLRARILDGTFKDINGIIVVKHGKIFIEEYFNGADPNALHDIRSAGKSITSALVGIALDKSLIKGVDERLLSYFLGVECSNDSQGSEKR